ncbi:hypothetical protein NW733_02730 [Mycoplasmopsis felis]|nr:hypothetical protein [Mycoplasmopsis felis]MCU9931609.1 hypothetical protein [Mycoplasmopsis felis]
MLLIKKFKKLTFILVPVCTLLPISLVSCSKDDKKKIIYILIQIKMF